MTRYKPQTNPKALLAAILQGQKSRNKPTD